MDEILKKVKIRLEQFHMVVNTDDEGNTESSMVFDDEDQNPILEEIIEEAWQDIKDNRKYPSSYTDTMIETDLAKFNKVVIRLALYDYNKLGADYESENRESDITRAYDKRETILADVVPIARVL